MLENPSYCYLIKKPEGFTQNRYSEKFILYKRFIYDFYPSKAEPPFYRIYEDSSWGQHLLIRDEEWFFEHFATLETLRNNKINEILGD